MRKRRSCASRSGAAQQWLLAHSSRRCTNLLLLTEAL
jgi:hypothetical protein